MCDSNDVRGKPSFFKKSDLLYRKFSSPNVERGRILVQLIVTQQYRKMVITLAQESIMAGHLAIKRTIQKVLSECFWPGDASGIKIFCQSCDICQRPIPKGKIIKTTLGLMYHSDHGHSRRTTVSLPSIPWTVFISEREAAELTRTWLFVFISAISAVACE